MIAGDDWSRPEGPRTVITIAMSVVVHAPRALVWRALADPRAIAERDAANGNGGAIDAPPDYPKPGQHVRWKYRRGGVPTTLHDRPIEVVPHERLRSLIELGALHFDETWTLMIDPVHPEQTRLALKLVASNATAVVGGVIDRFEMRRIATERVGTALESVRAWCTQSAPD
jgi:uncharacterized protein YndB with AHSA1/START domain